jgi:hypothetical protein
MIKNKSIYKEKRGERSMTNYKKLTITLLLLLTIISCIGTINAIDTNDNVTVEMYGVKFDAPTTNNNTTNFTNHDTGVIWDYEDYEHKLSVYVSDSKPIGYSEKEQVNPIDGVNQMTEIDGKWVVVSAADHDVKDMVWNSLRAA